MKMKKKQTGQAAATTQKPATASAITEFNRQSWSCATHSSNWQNCNNNMQQHNSWKRRCESGRRHKIPQQHNKSKQFSGRKVRKIGENSKFFVKKLFFWKINKNSLIQNCADCVRNSNGWRRSWNICVICKNAASPTPGLQQQTKTLIHADDQQKHLPKKLKDRGGRKCPALLKRFSVGFLFTFYYFY